MAGRAILAIAVSSEASASVVKIAATAQRLSSGGRPSIGGTDGFIAVGSNIAIGFSAPAGADAPSAACTTDGRRSTGVRLHDAYAKGRRGLQKRVRLRGCDAGFTASAPFRPADFRIPFRPGDDRLGSGLAAAAKPKKDGRWRGEAFARTCGTAHRNRA